MNQRLVKALPSDVKMRFETKLSRIDFRTKQAYGVSRPSDVAPGEEQTDTKLGGPSRPRDKRSAKEDSEGTPFDLVIGCDGSWSKVRSEMMRVQRCDSCSRSIRRGHGLTASQNGLLTVFHHARIHRTAYATQPNTTWTFCNGQESSSHLAQTFLHAHRTPESCEPLLLRVEHRGSLKIRMDPSP